jgi:diacylglycerol O-acyltransferase
MRQLSGLDNASLVGERGNVFNHVGVLMIYDVGTAPGGGVRYRDILRHFEQRLHLHPVFTNHLTSVPLGIDRPYWVAGSEVDLEYHIRHIALPAPGDWRQLMIQVARLHSRPLDRHRPLWEVYIIEGLDSIPKLPEGSFAMFLKVHHAAVDGMAAVRLVEELHTARPEKSAEDARRHALRGEAEPGTMELLRSTVGHNLSRAGKLARLTTDSTLRLLDAGRRQLRDLSPEKLAGIGRLLREATELRAPSTRFSEAVSAHRVMEGIGMPVSRIRRIRSKVPGVTLNDVFIAMAGGAARKYLEAKDELPDQSLVGLMPISLRSDASDQGNQVTGIPVPVCSDIADPLERLLAVHRETAAGKESAEKLGLDLIANVLDVAPPSVAKLLVDRLMLPRLNMAVSNVRGPDHDLYLAGARAMCCYPVSIPADGAGLNFTGISYNGVMWVSMVSCRRMLPDPMLMRSCMEASWQELLEAADALPAKGKRSKRPGPAGQRKQRPGTGKSRAKTKTKTKTKTKAKAKTKARVKRS